MSILGRDSIQKYRDVIEALRDVPPDELNRIYGHLHAETHQRWWVERYHLKQSKGTPCLHRLRGGKRQILAFRPPGCDHPSLWLLEGKPIVYVTQPYSIDVMALAEFCCKHGFVCRVDLWPAWHFPHRVFHIEITTEEGRAALDQVSGIQRHHACSTAGFT